MLQVFQQLSKSPIAKAFLLVVALSFAAFFGGSQYFMPDNNRYVAEVGDRMITIREFHQALQQEMKSLQARTEQDLSMRDLAESGLANAVLQSLVSKALLDLESDALGLAVSNMEILDTIHTIKAFQNDEGKFDRTLFDRILYSNQMTEDSFVEDVKSSLIRQQLTDAVMAGAFAPQALSDLLLNAKYQIRQGATVTIEPKNMTQPANPGDEVLENFYTEQKDSFMQPELRSFTALLLTPEMVLQDVNITEDDIQNEYEATKAELGDKPLAEVKKTVVKNLNKQLAADKLYELSQRLEDDLAGGATLEEIAKADQLKLMTVSDITLAGTKADGDTIAAFVPDPETQDQIISQAFSIEEGLESTFVETAAGDYFVVRADKVIPAQPLAFADIKNRVFNEWADAQKAQEAYKSAEKIAQGINLGSRIPGTLSLLPNISLANPPKDIPEELIEVLYRLSPQKAGIAPSDKGFVVVMLKAVIPPSNQTLNTEREKVEKESQRLLQADVLESYLKALRIRYPVKINWAAVQAVVGE